eukprot:8178406-Pyramimonas_sp.AAC.1
MGYQVRSPWLRKGRKTVVYRTGRTCICQKLSRGKRFNTYIHRVGAPTSNAKHFGPGGGLWVGVLTSSLLQRRCVYLISLWRVRRRRNLLYFISSSLSGLFLRFCVKHHRHTRVQTMLKRARR